MHSRRLVLGWMLSTALAGCGGNVSVPEDAGGGGAGPGHDAGSDAPDGHAPVLGTKQDGNCATADQFAAECKAEGGIPGDHCQNVSCSSEGLNATCYPTPPPPAQDEFSCELFNCKVGKVCTIQVPLPDGCFKHACATPPAPCTNTPTCACIVGNQLAFDCKDDAAGNATVTNGGAGWPP